ncbi:DUF6461 domain-containing protein [Streptomyces atroolivaceus]|uniref:DUF6461 domain-containing protein n=1 Tax=Streptomyces atroolivaceus TaxID=66869 RepID=UPI003631EFF0
MTDDGALRVGTAVYDDGSGRVGLVMGHDGPHLQLRPLGGGREWDAEPSRLRPLGPAELLSARVAEANARSRTGLGLADIRGAPHTGDDARTSRSSQDQVSVVRENVPAMSPSASEYSWFEHNELRSMYCMTYIKGQTPKEFLARLGVTPYPDQEGLTGLSSTHWTDPLDVDNHWQFIGATQVLGHDGPWTLAVELNGWIGESSEYMEPASTATRALSHYQNASGRTSFSWWEDGELRTRFEWPRKRHGSTPDDLVEAMQRVGFDLSPQGEDPGRPGMLALAEELSGVRVTAELLAGSSYTCGYFGQLPAVYRTGGKEPSPRPDMKLHPVGDGALADGETPQGRRRKGLGRGLGPLLRPHSNTGQEP